MTFSMDRFGKLDTLDTLRNLVDKKVWPVLSLGQRFQQLVVHIHSGDGSSLAGLHKMNGPAVSRVEHLEVGHDASGVELLQMHQQQRRRLVHFDGESGQTYLILFSIIPGCLEEDKKRTLLKTTNKGKHTEKKYRRKFRKLLDIIRAPKRVFRRGTSTYLSPRREAASQ
ncbi:hypothetical protein PG984_000462 [Apiospora sp. TS-2023a]